MSWDRVRKFYVDVDAGGGPPLLNGTKSSRVSNAPTFIQADHFPVRIYFRTIIASTEPTNSIALPTDSKMVIAAKSKDNLTSPSLLFFADDFTEVVEGNDTYYGADLDTNTIELNNLLNSKDRANIIVDIEVQDATNAERTTFQFEAVAKKQVYGNESAPSSAIPSSSVSATVSLSASTASGSITDLGLGYTPSQVLLTVSKPAGGANIWATAVDGSLSSDGCDFDLSAAPPTADYKLNAIFVP